MSVLTQLNLAVAGILPHWIWDWLQIVFGSVVVMGVVFQRSESERFQRKTIKCTGDNITAIIGQIGLTIIGTISFAVVIDGLLPTHAPPRTLVVLFLAGYSCVQIRTIYQVTARKWRAFAG